MTDIDRHSGPLAPLFTLDSAVLQGISQTDPGILLDSVLSALHELRIDDWEPLLTALDTLLNRLERDRAVGAVVLDKVLRQVSENVPTFHPLQTRAARACCLAGNRASDRKDFQAAFSSHDWSVQRLSSYQDQDAFELCAYAMERRAYALCRWKGVEEAMPLVLELVGIAASSSNSWVRNRALEAAWRWGRRGLQKSRYDDVSDVSRSALSLPMTDSNRFTHESFLELCSLKANADREAGRLLDALDTCEVALRFEPSPVTEQARESLAWCLAEGAFITAKQLDRPTDALIFCDRMIECFEHDEDSDIQGEVAYALSMRALALLQLSDVTQAAATLDDLDTRFSPKDRRVSVRAAVADAWIIRAQLSSQLGERAQSRKVLERLIEQFGRDRDRGIQKTVAEAREMLELYQLSQ